MGKLFFHTLQTKQPLISSLKVVQEAAVAKSGLLIWGQQELIWEHAMQTYLWMDERAPTLCEIVRFHIPVHQILYGHHHPAFAQTLRRSEIKYKLLAVLYEARYLQFSDPRDRILAFAALAQDLDTHVSVQPDYNAPFLHIYKQYAINYIRSTGDTELLDYVRHNEETLQSEAPSWVPRWDSRVKTLARARGSGWPPLKPKSLVACEPIFIESSILKVRGVVMDEVVWTSDTLRKDDMTFDSIFHIWEAVCHSEVESPYPTANLILSFLSVLAGGACQGEWSTWKQSEAACAVHLLEKTGHVRRDELARWRREADGGDVNPFINFVKVVSHDLKFILTRRGYMGLAPHVTKERDSCAIIFGCVASRILRKTDRESQYRILGSSYIAGKQVLEALGGGIVFRELGHELSKDWVEWDLEEQDIELR